MINERVQAEGAYFGEDKLVCRFVQGTQQPFQDKLIPYPHTLDEAVEKLTALEEAAAKISIMEKRSSIAAFAITTEDARANVSHNISSYPMHKVEKRVDHGDGRVTIHLIQEDGSKFYNFYMKGEAMCRHCHETGHTFPNCPAKAQGKVIKCVVVWSSHVSLHVSLCVLLCVSLHVLRVSLCVLLRVLLCVSLRVLLCVVV